VNRNVLRSPDVSVTTARARCAPALSQRHFIPRTYVPLCVGRVTDLTRLPST
jgi:hypothetical protein